MNSLKNRSRYRTGKTDYRHRLKLLQSYTHTLRVFLNKKNKYYVCGLYHTPDPSKADLCYGYYESRWLKTNDQRTLTNNQKDLKKFGAVMGSELNQKNVVFDFSSKSLILDLGRRKQIQFKPFLQGLFSTLDPALKDNFKVNQFLKSTFEPYDEEIPHFK